MASTEVLRAWPLVGASGLVFYGPVEDIIAGEPGLTLLLGGPASGKTTLLVHLASRLRNVQAWMPLPQPSILRFPTPTQRTPTWLGGRHPLCGDDLLSLALLCEPTSRTLLIDDGFQTDELTLWRLEHWRTLAEDSGHRIVVVVQSHYPVFRDLDRETIRQAATRVIYMGTPPFGVNFIPDVLRDRDYRPAPGDMAIWRPADPAGAVVRKVPSMRQP